MKTAEIVEGKTRLLVPPESLTGLAPPTSPVFFNPAASINRDVTVSIARASGGSTFCDAMAGIGARGLRVAKEAPEIPSVTLIDFNKLALGLSRRSARLNQVTDRCEFVQSETSSFLWSKSPRHERFENVDIDPFGSPATLTQAGIAATADGGLISVTATDTAALCGVYPKTALRRYGALSLNNEFHHETAIRILCADLARKGGAADVGISPVAAHSTRHYVRIYARLTYGASRADHSLGKIGFVLWCPHCLHTASGPAPPRACSECGKIVKTAGPLWLGPLTESQLISRAEAEAERLGYKEAAKILGSLEGIDGFPPWSFSIEEACSRLKVATVSESAVREGLEKVGRKSLRQPFEATGLKTDAPYREFLDTVRACSTMALTVKERES